ncbi:MAG TPA: HAD-IA family hydrolase [Gammaproteobacteria bacterium]|nr:HAD-IA family hydrolase [Gammaproteobacteria bacterium]
MLRALVWDVDGTLAETERDGHRVAFNRAFEEFGMPRRWSEARYGELLKVPGGRERLLADMAAHPDALRDDDERMALATSLHRLKNVHYARLVAEGAVDLRPGVRELMDDCQRLGVQMAIATTTSRANVEALLDTCLGRDGRPRFAAVVCAEDAPSKKPDPQVYALCLRRLGIAAHEAIAIEDSPAGVAAARAAGVPVVVTRSRYFADERITGAFAVGPGLDSIAGWTPRAGRRGRVTLTQLMAWRESLLKLSA